MNSIGYCTNVHAGTTLQDVQNNLQKYALDVRKQLGLADKQASFRVGLWLSNKVSQELTRTSAADAFRDWLAEHQLVPYTLNGFPFSDFHQPVVKHEVYLPTWAEKSRLDYTLNLIHVLNQLLPAGELGTISTLPIGWPQAPKNRQAEDLNSRFSLADQQTLRQGASNLLRLSDELAQLEASTGRHIKVCLEPEPLCLLDCAQDVKIFFETLLLDAKNEDQVRRYLGVCHDVCHSAVMFEPQSDAIEMYQSFGIDIGKVQVSSAVEAVFSEATDETERWNALSEFAEPRYLHQTSIQQRKDQSTITHFEDLKFALKEHEKTRRGFGPSGQTWRVHFHVPIFLRQLDHLGTTQTTILQCLDALKKHGFEETHLEVETYAWNVLPESQREESLATGIAKEIAWLEERTR